MSEAEIEGQEPTPNEDPTPDPWAAFPAEFNWVRKELEEARKQAAKDRVRAKELQEQLASAKTPEEVQSIISAHDAKTAELELQIVRLNAARNAELPEEMLEFLDGRTPEEIEAKAAKLAAFKPAPGGGEPVVVTQQQPRGGSDPSSDPESDGFAAYKRWKESKRL